MNRPYLISNILLQVALISIFIIILFFTYGISLEKDILDKQINYVVQKFKILRLIMPNTDISNNPLINSIKVEDNPEIIKQIDDNNNKLKKKSIIIILILFLVVIITVLFIGFKYKIIDDNKKQLRYGEYIKNLLKDNLLILLFVGLTYTAFITFIGHKYLYINPNLIVKNVYEKIVK